jgi:hypothetical protein
VLVRAQAELDVREGRKHSVQLGFASQRLSDMAVREAILACLAEPRSIAEIARRIGCPRTRRCCKRIS